MGRSALPTAWPRARRRGMPPRPTGEAFSTIAPWRGYRPERVQADIPSMVRSSRKLLRWVAAAFLAVVLAAMPWAKPTGPSEFVTRSGAQLLLSGEAHQFTGVDAYELGTDWG